MEADYTTWKFNEQIPNIMGLGTCIRIYIYIHIQLQMLGYFGYMLNFVGVCSRYNDGIVLKPLEISSG